MTTIAQLIATMNSEMKDVFKKFNGKVGQQTRIKIKSGSTIEINGAIATLLNDVTVLTNYPDKLMKNDKH